ncbi:Phosphorelay intermediate protein [Dimargaris xerosporica]|nr:Phosphorelay intermediate protein [Dimargaris xerosporica]
MSVKTTSAPPTMTSHAQASQVPSPHAANDPQSPTDRLVDDDELDADTIINRDTFSQLLEMDDEDSCDFTKSLVDTLHEQAMTTFAEMDQKLAAKDLPALSRLGHFLKGSSASVGLLKVPITCGRIQNYGNLLDESGTEPLDKSEAFSRITAAIAQLKTEYAEANEFFKTVFETD